MTNFKRTSTLLVFLLLTNYLSAITVIYDEAVSGDLTSVSGKWKTFELGPGTNKLFGTASLFDSINRTDFDGFLVKIKEGLKLDSVVHSVTGFRVTDDTQSIYLAYSLRTPNAKPGEFIGFGNTGNILNTPSVTMFDGTLPIRGSSELVISPNHGSRNGEGGYWDYEFTMNVSAVPDSTDSLASIGLGVAMLVLARRKIRKIQTS